MSVDVAIACCRRSSTADPADLYPDPDAAALQSSLADLGASVVAVSWDDARVDWGSFARVLISSTWDDVDRPAEFLEWTSHVASATNLLNHKAIVNWAIDKRHQIELARHEVPTIPTTWVEPTDRWVPPSHEFVIKPSISAGSRLTARYPAGTTDRAIEHMSRLQSEGRTAMVQEYLARVDEEGELNVVFIDGTFSHAVRKHPVLQLGEGPVDRPWERMTWAGLAIPTAEELVVAEKASNEIANRFGAPPTYGRIDLVNGPDGRPLVLEVELIDPLLSLELLPSASDRLARAVLRSR